MLQIEYEYYRIMQEKCIENPRKVAQYISKVKIIGKHPFVSQTEARYYPVLSLRTEGVGVYCPQLESKPENYVPYPKKIFVQGNLICLLDSYDNLWVISQLFPVLLNVSLMIFRRVRQIYLGQGQCIIANRRHPIIMNWGAKKILDLSDCQQIKLNEKYAKGFAQYFTAHQIEKAERDDKFFYSNIKKIDNSNKLYHIRTQLKSQKQCQEIVKQINDKNKRTYHNKSVSNEKNQSLKNGNYYRFSSSSKKMFKKINTNLKVSQIQEQFKEIYSIISFPTSEVFYMKRKIVGISIGKVHCLCWDVQGSVFSWGSRSLALGFEQLPHQKLTCKPRRVNKLNRFIIMCYAATHYSLALSSDGEVFEWGIKKQKNQINQQLLFEPKILKIGEQQNKQKIIMLKGKQDCFGCINSKHQLYIWGEKSSKFLHPDIISVMGFKNGRIYSPFLIPYFQGEDIVDFGFGDQFIAVLTTKQAGLLSLMSEQERIYWGDMITRVRRKLKLNATIKTQGAQINSKDMRQAKFRNSQLQLCQLTPLQVPVSDQYQSSIQKAYYERSLKRQYFQSLRNQDQFYINLLKDEKSSTNIDSESNLVHDQQKRKKSSYENNSISERNQNIKFDFAALFKTRREESESNKNIYKRSINKMIPSLSKKNVDFLESHQLTLLNAKKYIRSIFTETLKQAHLKPKNPQQFEALMKASKITESKKIKPVQSYQMRLQRVQQRKKSLDESYNHHISKKVQENSFEFRTMRHEQIIEAKTFQRNRSLVKNTLHSFLVKQYLIRMILSPIQQARQIKIALFAKSLHLSRIQKNLRLVFIKAKVRLRLKKLQKKNFITYALLCTVFKRYVRKRRQEKNRIMKKIIVNQIYKNILRDKIRFGLSKSHLNTRKLQKFRQWLVLTKIQRLKCLKILWRNHLLSVMKLANDGESLVILKAQQNCSFETLYKQRVALNPMLKLQTFLNKSPIFQLRCQYFQSLIFLFKKDNKVKSEKILKGMKTTRRKQKMIKFTEGQTISLNSNIQSSNDLLPYSLHYNLLVRPKSMEINIPESMKKNERWIREEVLIFEKCLKQIIQLHQKNFLKARRKYDSQLAYFIRQKYDSLAEKRWKFIIQYNQIKVTPYKKKKQKELYRIFDLIGMQKVLNEDCLPEKYLMLEEGMKKRDAPQPPNNFIVFGLLQFKEIFKKYYQIISIRAKQARKNFI